MLLVYITHTTRSFESFWAKKCDPETQNRHCSAGAFVLRFGGLDGLRNRNGSTRHGHRQPEVSGNGAIKAPIVAIVDENDDELKWVLGC